MIEFDGIVVLLFISDVGVLFEPAAVFRAWGMARQKRWIGHRI